MVRSGLAVLAAALALAMGPVVWAAPDKADAAPAGGSAAASAASTEAAATPGVEWPDETKVEVPKDDPAERARIINDLKQKYARTVRTVDSRITPRPGLDFEQASVHDVLMYLAEIGHFSIILDKALEEQGIDLATRVVTIRVSGITYEKAIELVLPRECGYRVGPGYVLITTMEKAWLPLRTATYSIRLHLAEIPNFTDAPRFEVGDVTQAASQAAGGGGAFGDLFGGGAAAAEDEGKATPEKIIDLVKRFVRHDNDRRIAPWDDEGGPATIQYLGGRLIVSQTEHGHRAVARLLASIE